MADSNKSEQSQSQENVISNIHFGDGDNSFTFAPVQIGTQIQTQIIQVPVEKVLQQELIKASPYQGLRRFNTKDSSRFFGRATAIADLRETVNHNSLTLVLGASGSGKSSLVRAGLMPSITAALDLQTFYGFVFTPTQDPFDAFYRCLRSEEKDYSYSASEAQIALEAQENTFQKVINTLKKKGERWLIFIDQFEELFTVCKDEDKRHCFISSLMQVAEAEDESVKIVLAMRADFLGQFTTRPEFRSINQENYYVVHPMYPDELRQAIEQPALQHGVVFEAGLIEQIVKDIEGQKGYLPLLQYALNLLWISECKKLGTDGRPHIEDRTLNRKTYNLLGGVRGALQKHVNEIYDNLDQEGQDSAKQIFLNLVDIVESDTGRKTVSRQAYRNEFTGEPLLQVLDTFIDEDLLVSGSEFLEDYTTGEYPASSPQVSTVEIAHEVLIHSWDELSKWLEEEEEIVILRNWLASEVKRWERVRTEDS
ncbi:MAG: ATP-binding protein, partial [Cyanobacteria bacterium P01_F01_bin.3]